MNTPHAISALISSEALPALCPETDTLTNLIRQLSLMMHCTSTDQIEFLSRAIKTMALYGDCTGIAYIPPNSQEPVLCCYLRSEILLSVEQNPSLHDVVTVASGTMALLQMALQELSTSNSQWAFLSALPDPTQNRVTYFHSTIMAAPAYPLVAARLHRGICAKAAQVQGLPREQVGRVLGGATRYLDRIVWGIPVTAGIDELDTIVGGIIQGLSKQRIGPNGSRMYATATLSTIEDIWMAAFYAGAADKKFNERGHRVTAAITNDYAANPEPLPATNPIRAPFLDQVQTQHQIERTELLGGDQPHRHQKRSWISGEGTAVVDLNPSSNSQGTLSIIVVALVLMGLDALKSVYTELNWRALFTLVNSMLHLGRRPEWLLRLRLAYHPPASFADCAQPMYVEPEHTLYYVPAVHIGLPPRLNPFKRPQMNVHAEWLKHNQNYDPNSLVYRIRLPDHLANIYDQYIHQRVATLRRWPLDATALNGSSEASPLWIWDTGNFASMDIQSVTTALNALTDRIRRAIPRHPPLTATNFTRTFEGWYASLGLPGVYRYYISEITRADCEMPLRYSLIDSESVYQSHNACCSTFVGRIIHEQSEINNGRER